MYTELGAQAPIIGLEDGWDREIKIKALEQLEAMLDGGLKKTKLFSNQEYVNIYTICYNMCTQRAPYNWSEQLYQKHGDQLGRYLSNNVLPRLKMKSNEFLLQELVNAGKNHEIMNKWYKQFFMYLDRYYVKYHSLATLEEAGLRYFKAIAFDHVKTDVCDAILVLINRERENESNVDRSLIRSCVQLFEHMGMGSLDVYVANLEVSLLESSRNFYARKAAVWIEEDSTPDYLIKAEAALDSERLRVKQYLNSDTELKLLRVLEEELLQKREQELLEKDGSGCRALLVNERGVDLARMFSLFSRVPLGLVPMAEIVRQYIVDAGTEKIEQRILRASTEGQEVKELSSKAEKDGGGKDDKDSSDDPQFIKDLLEVHDKFVASINTHFNGNALFQKALKDAFVEIVNRDVGRFKTAELLSSFCDRILKTGSSEKLSDTEIEDYLDKTVQLFSYLTDKDLFAEIYRTQLSKRLLNQRSASEDMEKSMIGRLKIRCGSQFTAKMEGMLTDLSIGADHAKLFEDFLASSRERDKTRSPSSSDSGAPLISIGKMDFTVQTLTAGNWPTYKAYDVVLPPQMQKATQLFKEFYDLRSSGSHRRLQWIHQLGSVTLKGMFAKKSYDLQLVTLQAVVLLHFNASPNSANVGVRTFSELAESLSMPEEVMKRVLHSLACGKQKVLTKMSVGSDKDSKSIKVTDSFSVNDQFSCPMRKVRIPMASLEDGGGASSAKRVDEDRNFAIEAAIVRIMKARKTLSHQQLLAEVLTQLAFFRPDPKAIKRRIEALIEREYLERDAENSSNYKYLA